MTVCEREIFNTIKENIETMRTNRMIAILVKNIQKKRFKQALNSLKQKGYVRYNIAFISVIVQLTDKGWRKVESEL
jgi:Mn-dependent DtxR family transcriptional regulator